MSAPTPHMEPNPELIAAFIDGGLQGDELQRVQSLIADDPAWREIFVEVRQLQLDEDSGSVQVPGSGAASAPASGNEAPASRVVPIAEGRGSAQRQAAQTAQPPPPRAWLAIAASIVLLGITAPYWLRLLQPAVPRSTTLLAEAAPEATMEGLGTSWTVAEWTDARGPSSIVDDKADFRVGVLLLKMRLAGELGEGQLADGFAQQILDTLRGSATLSGELAADSITPSFAALRAPDASSAARRQALEQIDDTLHQTFAQSDAYRVGRWAWSALLAAQSGNERYLSSRRYRTGLEFARGLPLDQPAIASLEALSQSNELASASAALQQFIAALGSWNTPVFVEEGAASD